MIDYGKIYYLLGSIMPCTPDDLILGFTPKEIRDVYAYQELIWSRIIEEEWLYVTDEFTKKKMLGERPKTIELGDDCPGRVGAWIGWPIAITTKFLLKASISPRTGVNIHLKRFKK
jgi:hypothetical protein